MTYDMSAILYVGADVSITYETLDSTLRDPWS